MEILATAEHPAPRPVGDAVPGLAAGEGTHALARLLVCHHCELGDAYLLHDHAAHSLLERTHGRWSGVSEMPVSLSALLLSPFFFPSLLPQSDVN